MDRLRFWDRLTQSDRMLAWIREQDGPRARKTLTKTTILMVLLLPVFAIQFKPYTQKEAAQSLSGTGLIEGIFICSLFAILAFLSDHKISRRFDFIELVVWFLLVSLFASFATRYGMSRIGVPPLVDFTEAGDKAYDEVVSKAIAIAQNAALVGWIISAIMCLALLISTRGLPCRPLPYAIFLISVVGFYTYDNNLYETVRGPVTFLYLAAAVIFFMNLERYQRWAAAYRTQCASIQQKDQEETRLAFLIDTVVHDRLQRGERVADSYSNLTVIFADMVGFTALSRRVSPGHLVDLLNEIFAAGDQIGAEYGIEKVKTIGDCYMAVAGGIASSSCSSTDAIGFAQRYLKKVEEVSLRLDIPLALRVGIHTGPAVGGIIGTSRPAYDYWGDTVNLASRLESASGAGRILVSDSTWLQTKRDFEFEDCNDIEVKGVGSVRSHFIAQEVPDDNVISLVQRT